MVTGQLPLELLPRGKQSPHNNYSQLPTGATIPLVTSHQDNYPPRTITPVGQSPYCNYTN